MRESSSCPEDYRFLPGPSACLLVAPALPDFSDLPQGRALLFQALTMSAILRTRNSIGTYRGKNPNAAEETNVSIAVQVLQVGEVVDEFVPEGELVNGAFRYPDSVGFGVD